MADAGVERRTEQVPEWKRREVEEIQDLLERYDCVGVVNVAGIPSRQLQKMRQELRGTAELRISRNTLIIRALEAVDEGYERLTGEIAGQVGLVATERNPFALFRTLEASKTPAPITAGDVAPNDIVIPAGDTGIDPGPFVGELQQVGANARIEDGSIRVLEDSTVLEAGEEATAQLANVLAELGMEPKEVGLDLRVAFADGVLFERDELELDVEAYREDVSSAVAAGRNLSVNAGYPTVATAGALLGKAARAARSVGVHAAIEDPDLVDDLLARADAEVRAIAALVDDEEALPDDLRTVEGDDDDVGGDEDVGGDGTAGDRAEETGEGDQTEAGSEDDETGADDADTDADTDTDTDTDADADADAGDEEGDDTDEDGGAALGDMFG